jgi:hypothetical protein
VLISKGLYKENEVDSNSSVKSDDEEIFSEVRSTSYRSSVETLFHTGIEMIASILTSDADLLLLYQDAIKMINGERLVQNQRRLLKKYYLGLRSQARLPLALEVIKILRSRRTRISIAQTVLVQLSSPRDYDKDSARQIS